MVEPQFDAVVSTPGARMKDLGERRWTVPDGKPGIPFMYSLVARKHR